MTSMLLVAISSFLAALLVAIILAYTRQRSRSRGSAFLLVGPPDSGKTAILSQLVSGRALQTHTSLQTNSSVVDLSDSKKTIRVIDIPGHPRIRDQFREHLNDARAIAFVVDASTVSRNGAQVAEHIHNILHTLTLLPPSQTLPSLVILAHKYDLLNAGNQTNSSITSLAINRVKSVLERELEKRRASQSGGVAVESLGAEDEKSEMGGLDCNGPSGTPFKFSEWEGGEILFLATSAHVSKPGTESEKYQDDGLISLKNWLEEVI
ncbi:hypothetical protein H0H93_013749 [Arthromyces matolae]|nr:hypothetical protein H0H93_013749 [Arthromyces matolae]